MVEEIERLLLAHDFSTNHPKRGCDLRSQAGRAFQGVYARDVQRGHMGAPAVVLIDTGSETS